MASDIDELGVSAVNGGRQRLSALVSAGAAPAAAGLVLAASASTTWVILDRISPPAPPPESAAAEETVDLVHGGAKVLGTVALAFDATTARVPLPDVVVPIEASPEGSARLVLRDVVVSGVRTTLVWSGSGPLTLQGALTLDGGRLIGGSTDVVVDDSALRIGPGALRLDGTLARIAPRSVPPAKVSGSPGAKQRAGHDQLDPPAIDVIVDERSEVSVIGRIRLGLAEGQAVSVHAPVAATGDLEVSGPRIVDGAYRRIDITSGLAHLRVSDHERLVFDGPVFGTIRLEP